MQNPRIVIIGGLGKTGRRVFDRLHARGVAAAAASRSTTPRFDWTDRSTWAGALRVILASHRVRPRPADAPTLPGPFMPSRQSRWNHA